MGPRFGRLGQATAAHLLTGELWVSCLLPGLSLLTHKLELTTLTSQVCGYENQERACI